MAKMKMKELKNCEETIGLFGNGILWELDFSLKLKDSLESPKEILETFREDYLKLIQANNGEEIQTPRGKQWGLKPPVPCSLKETATSKEVEEADAKYKAEYEAFIVNNEAIEVGYAKMLDTDITVNSQRIPVGEFKENFTYYLVPDLKGKKFSLSPSDIESLEWLIMFSKKKK